VIFDKLELNPENHEGYLLQYSYEKISMTCTVCSNEFYALPFYVSTDNGKPLCTACAEKKNITLTDITKAYNTNIGLKIAEHTSNSGQKFQIVFGIDREAPFTIEELDELLKSLVIWAENEKIISAWFMKDYGDVFHCKANSEDQKDISWNKKARKIVERFGEIEAINLNRLSRCLTDRDMCSQK